MTFTTVLLIVSPFIVLTFWAIMDLAYRDFGSLKKKALWGAFIFVPFLGGPIYLIFGRRGGKKISYS